MQFECSDVTFLSDFVWCFNFLLSKTLSCKFVMLEVDFSTRRATEQVGCRWLVELELELWYGGVARGG